MSEEQIILVSTRTVDRMPLPVGGYREIPGGPAHYVGDALARLGRRYRLITGERAIVEVISGEHGEEYLIPSLAPIELPDTLSADAVILSPVIGEIHPRHLPPIAGLLTVDLQGFVREPNRPTGSATGPFDLRELLARADIVKSSEAELARLTPESRQLLDHTLLLVTCGEKGAHLHQNGRAHHIAARPIHGTHTIGAGDCYLAAFVSALLDGHSPEESGAHAARFTEEMLRLRRSAADLQPEG